MARDLLKDNDYFIDFIDKNNSRIVKFENLLLELLSSDINNVNGIRIYKLKLFSLHFEQFKAKYSMGEDINQLAGTYGDILDYFTNTWRGDTGSYIDMISMLSLGILLDIEEEKFNLLIKLLENNNYYDCFINFMINFRSNLQVNNKITITFTNIYDPIVKIIKNFREDTSNAVENLEKYLSKTWYKSMRDCGWYDVHKSNYNLYSGYWSFESAVVSKILSLNDINLNKTPYYPYDLVHYK